MGEREGALMAVGRDGLPDNWGGGRLRKKKHCTFIPDNNCKSEDETALRQEQEQGGAGESQPGCRGTGVVWSGVTHVVPATAADSGIYKVFPVVEEEEEEKEEEVVVVVVVVVVGGGDVSISVICDWYSLSVITSIALSLPLPCGWRGYSVVESSAPQETALTITLNKNLSRTQSCSSTKSLRATYVRRSRARSELVYASRDLRRPQAGSPQEVTVSGSYPGLS
ncbi:hypothetical protein E2C01_033915 [Portunus trituberculatus]|uniref:Uncharacterized protein n=1 Tax=Portunus trituberculatus TaxID=210409 RepID=A0A5B7F500_PORTR|nr:hypothetical protein [Portunus trituberculatus]